MIFAVFLQEQHTVLLTLCAGNVRVLLRVFPTASTQTYSARTVSSGIGKSKYFCMTVGSSCDCPVIRLSGMTPPTLIYSDDDVVVLVVVVVGITTNADVVVDSTATDAKTI